MGEVGRLDLDLMKEYRGAPKGSPVKRRLLGELLAQNEGLVVTLVHQLRGEAPKAQHARFARGPSVRGADRQNLEECLHVGRIALMKAMDQYDPNKSRLSGYLRKKIFHELQCLVTKASIVKVHRDARKPDMAYFEDDDHMGRLLGGSDDDDDDLEELEPVVDEPPAAPAPAPVVAPASRTALEELLVVHCRFATAARVPALTLRGRLDSIMRAHQEHVAVSALLEQLDARGVRETRIRVPWSPSPVRAFAGVGLRCGVDPPDYEVRLESPGHH